MLSLLPVLFVSSICVYIFPCSLLYCVCTQTPMHMINILFLALCSFRVWQVRLIYFPSLLADAGSSRDERPPQCSDADWGGGGRDPTGHLQEVHRLRPQVGWWTCLHLTTMHYHLRRTGPNVYRCVLRYFFSVLIFWHVPCSKCGPRLSAVAAEKLKNRYVLMRSGAREHERETDKRPSIPITVR